MQAIGGRVHQSVEEEHIEMVKGFEESWAKLSSDTMFSLDWCLFKGCYRSARR